MEAAKVLLAYLKDAWKRFLDADIAYVVPVASFVSRRGHRTTKRSRTALVTVWGSDTTIVMEGEILQELNVYLAQCICGCDGLNLRGIGAEDARMLESRGACDFAAIIKDFNVETHIQGMTDLSSTAASINLPTQYKSTTPLDDRRY